MKHKILFCLLMTIFLSGNVFISGQTIYLSPGGNDSNPGTREKPLATLNGARDKLREYKKSENADQPREIIAMEGEYFLFQPLTLSYIDGGTENHPLVIKADEGKKVVFSGGAEISGFEKVNEKLWRTFIPQAGYYDYNFEQLYVNGRRAVRARTPNEGFFRVKSVNEIILDKGEGRAPALAVQQVGLDPADTLSFASFTEQDFEDALIIFYHNWDNTRRRITGFSRQSASVFMTGEGMKPWNPINNKSRYFVENYRAALDAPGEWFLDKEGYLYYIPVDGETIENTRFLVPVLEEFVIIRGDQEAGKKVENIKFENLVFEVAVYHTPVRGNEPAQAAAPVNAVIRLDFAANIEFRNCEIAHTGTYAFWFRQACSKCVVDHCYIHDLGAGGIKIGETTIRENPEEITNNIGINNNIIRDGGHVFPCAVGIIIFNASDNKLTHNEIADLKYSGISVGWVWGYAFSPSKRNEIKYNHIHHLGWAELCDMGGVYTLGASEGTVVANNHIHHIHSFDYGGWGLYTDEGSYGITMENNLVYACKNSGFHQHYGRENIIRNNIFASNIRAQLQATRIEEHLSLTFTNNIIYFDRGSLLTSNWHKFNFLSDNNCYWDTRTKNILFGELSFTEWRKSGKDVHSVIADPGFINPSAFDFRLRNSEVTRKIKFKPFDYTEAGVYGSEEWKKLAVFDSDREAKFNERVMLLENK